MPSVCRSLLINVWTPGGALTVIHYNSFYLCISFSPRFELKSFWWIKKKKTVVLLLAPMFHSNCFIVWTLFFMSKLASTHSLFNLSSILSFFFVCLFNCFRRTSLFGGGYLSVIKESCLRDSRHGTEREIANENWDVALVEFIIFKQETVITPFIVIVSENNIPLLSIVWQYWKKKWNTFFSWYYNRMLTKRLETLIIY